MVRYVCHVCSMCMSCKYNVNNFLTNSILHDTQMVLYLSLSLLYSIFFNTCHVICVHVIFPRYYISSDTSTSTSTSTTRRYSTSRYWYRIDIHL